MHLSIFKILILTTILIIITIAAPQPKSSFTTSPSIQESSVKPTLKLTRDPEASGTRNQKIQENVNPSEKSTGSEDKIDLEDVTKQFTTNEGEATPETGPIHNLDKITPVGGAVPDISELLKPDIVGGPNMTVCEEGECFRILYPKSDRRSGEGSSEESNEESSEESSEESTEESSEESSKESSEEESVKSGIVDETYPPHIPPRENNIPHETIIVSYLPHKVSDYGHGLMKVSYRTKHSIYQHVQKLLRV